MVLELKLYIVCYNEQFINMIVLTNLFSCEVVFRGSCRTSTHSAVGTAIGVFF